MTIAIGSVLWSAGLGFLFRKEEMDGSHDSGHGKSLKPRPFWGQIYSDNMEHATEYNSQQTPHPPSSSTTCLSKYILSEVM